jgi:hypothetical protein
MYIHSCARYYFISVGCETGIIPVSQGSTSLVPIRWFVSELCRRVKNVCRAPTSTSGAFTPVTHPSSHSRYDSSQNRNSDSGNWLRRRRAQKTCPSLSVFLLFCCFIFSHLWTEQDNNNNNRDHPSKSHIVHIMMLSILYNEQTPANGNNEGRLERLW